MKVSHRSRGLGCAVCSGHSVWPGLNDLATVAPDVAKTLDAVRCEAPAEEIYARSRRTYPWRCELGHGWNATAKNRVVNGSGCPVCSGNQVLAGFNDLATVNPEIARQWLYPRNGELTPRHVTTGSQKRVWWICDEGHEWEVAVVKRKDRGCPKCALKGTSRVERELFEGCAAWLDEAEHLGYARLGGKRLSLDISGNFRGARVVVEYDGSYFHADAVGRDTVKTTVLLDAGFVVVRVRESNNTALDELPIAHPALVQVRHRFGDSVEALAEVVRERVTALLDEAA